VTKPFNHTVLGKTRDDAAGEAFDKIGKMLNLPYPAGPYVDRHAKSGNLDFVDFPRAMVKKGLDFSFSGLKTSVLYHLQEQNDSYINEHLNDLCASVSAAISDVLVIKLRRAVRETGTKHVMVAGGVSANSMLREKVQVMAKKEGVNLMIPAMEYCTDNAAMIAKTGEMKARLGQFDGLELKPFASMPA